MTEEICQEFTCERLHRNKVSVRDRFYCSQLCAQQAARGQGQSTGSKPMVASTIRVHGEQSKESLRDESESSSGLQKTLSEKHESQESDTTETPNDTEQLGVRAGKDGWTATQKKSGSGIAIIEGSRTRQVSSGQQSPNLDEGNSELMDLLNDSISHLHGLMKSVGHNVKERAKMNERIGSLDPQAINSAVNCAKEMREMMKLKIEVSRGGK